MTLVQILLAVVMNMWLLLCILSILEHSNVLQVSLDYSREERVQHEEVLETSKMQAEVLQKLVTRLISRCQQENINTN